MIFMFRVSTMGYVLSGKSVARVPGTSRFHVQKITKLYLYVPFKWVQQLDKKKRKQKMLLFVIQKSVGMFKLADYW